MKNLFIIISVIVFFNLKGQHTIALNNASLNIKIKSQVMNKRYAVSNQGYLGSLRPQIDSTLNTAAEYHCYWLVENDTLSHEEVNESSNIQAITRFYNVTYHNDSYENLNIPPALTLKVYLSYNQTMPNNHLPTENLSEPFKMDKSKEYGFVSEIICRVPNRSQSEEQLAKDIVNTYMSSTKGHKEQILGTKYSNTFGSFTILDKEGKYYYNVIVFGYKNFEIRKRQSIPTRPSNDVLKTCKQLEIICDKEIELNKKANDDWVFLNEISKECVLMYQTKHDCIAIFNDEAYYQFYDELEKRRIFYKQLKK